MRVESLPGGYYLVVALAALYGAALLTSAPAVIMKRQSLARLGLALMIAAFVLNTWIIIGRWVEAGRPPFKTMYETLLFYPWCVAVVSFVLIYFHKLKVLIPFAAAISAAGLAYALSNPDLEIINLPPALRSGWFVPHVVTYFVAYAALFASFALAVLALFRPQWSRARDENDENGDGGGEGFEKYANDAALFGIAALTLGLVMGAVWGKVAWGDYWSWDPKENWALVSWLLYMVYLHLRLMGEWRGRRAMWVLVAAFGAVLFTYLGMSLLPTAGGSLHVYQ